MPQFGVNIRIGAYIADGQGKHILAHTQHLGLHLLSGAILLTHIGQIGIAHCLLSHRHIEAAGRHCNASWTAG